MPGDMNFNGIMFGLMDILAIIPICFIEYFNHKTLLISAMVIVMSFSILCLCGLDL